MLPPLPHLLPAIALLTSHAAAAAPPVGWHGGSAAPARERFERMDAEERRRLVEWASAP